MVKIGAPQKVVDNHGFPSLRLRQMAWPNKATAEEVIGMSADDLKKQLESAASKADVTAVGEQVKQFSDSINELRDSLRTLASKPITEAVTDPPDPTTQVLVDPAGFVRQETADVRKMQLETQAQVMEMRARQGPLANVFTQYGDDMLKRAYAFPVEHRAQGNFWDTFVRTFLGDKLVAGDIKSQYPSLIGNSTVGVNPTGDRRDPGSDFSPAVKDYLNERHIPLDKAAKIQKLFDMGEPLTIANYKGDVGNA